MPTAAPHGPHAGRPGPVRPRRPGSVRGWTRGGYIPKVAVLGRQVPPHNLLESGTAGRSPRDAALGLRLQLVGDCDGDEGFGVLPGGCAPVLAFPCEGRAEFTRSLVHGGGLAAAFTQGAAQTPRERMLWGSDVRRPRHGQYASAATAGEAIHRFGRLEVWTLSKRALAWRTGQVLHGGMCASGTGRGTGSTTVEKEKSNTNPLLPPGRRATHVASGECGPCRPGPRGRPPGSRACGWSCV